MRRVRLRYPHIPQTTSAAIALTLDWSSSQHAQLGSQFELRLLTTEPHIGVTPNKPIVTRRPAEIRIVIDSDPARNTSTSDSSTDLLIAGEHVVPLTGGITHARMPSRRYRPFLQPCRQGRTCSLVPQHSNPGSRQRDPYTWKVLQNVLQHFCMHHQLPWRSQLNSEFCTKSSVRMKHSVKVQKQDGVVRPYQTRPPRIELITAYSRPYSFVRSKRYGSACSPTERRE